MRAVLLLPAALCLTAPAAAQDGSEATTKRTVEAAQKFLSEFYSQGDSRAKAMGYVSNGHWSQIETPDSVFSMVEGPVTGMETTDRCKSRLTISPAIGWRFNSAQARVPVAADSGRISVLFDWSAVKKISTENDWTGYFDVLVTEMTTPGRTNSVYLSHLSKESADRAAFAIQYLKDECGFKSETGF